MLDIDWLQAQFPKLQNLTALSAGGQKTVLGATDVDGRAVVLKLLHPTQPAEFAEREIRAVIRIGSKRTPEILETGILQSPTGPIVWVKEVRVEGETLRQRLERGPLTPAELRSLGEQLLEVLVDAESHSIVHRDVKPENIIIDSSGQFWLIDFGIARHLDLPALTDPSARFGKMTIGYAPPEQCRNVQSEIDSRADLFALGVTMYESALGYHPFRRGARDQMDVLRRVESEKIPRLLVTDAMSASMVDLLDSLVQKQRYHRPRTAAEALAWMRSL